ncbi:hypothetical protein Bbelb_310990 [Branchiostoma belcheri]|nr:hypothetical protein Bbelb_310990 [Branchiostoma belcheri]
MDEPPVKEPQVEQAANETNIKEEKTEDTGWQQEEQEGVRETKEVENQNLVINPLGETYSKDQETYGVNLRLTRYPLNVTHNSGEQTAGTGRQQGVLSEETCEVKLPTGCLRNEVHIKEEKEDSEWQQGDDFKVNDTGPDQEVSPQTTLQSSTIQEGSHVAEHTFICWKCGYRAAERSLMFKHMRQHSGGKPYKCDQCDYSAAQKSQVDDHVLRNIPCDYCTAVRSNLKSHTAKHTGEKPYRCGECGYRTAFKSGLSRHLKTHTGAKPFKCDQCDYSAAQKGRLDEHVITKHTDEKPHICEECGYRTAFSAALSRHKKTHLIEKQNKCDQCESFVAHGTNIECQHLYENFGFDRQQQSQQKTTSKEDKRSFKCDQCDYSAPGRRDLDQHVMIKHTGEKPYACTDCAYRTAVKSHLSRHIKTHTGEKPYKCDRCDYSAAQKGHLDKHVMVKHTGEKPYMCGECGYRTADRSALSQHKRTHTGEKPYMCEECGYRTEMDESTCGPPIKKLRAEQLDMTHIKEEETEDTQWQQDKEEDVSHQEAYSANLPTGYFGNVTHIKEEDTGDTGSQQDNDEDLPCQEAYNKSQETHGVRLPSYPLKEMGIKEDDIPGSTEWQQDKQENDLGQNSYSENQQKTGNSWEQTVFTGQQPDEEMTFPITKCSV